MNMPPQAGYQMGGFLTVTLAYWAFMLTDGALRMLVLLHFHIMGFTPLQLAYLFVVYEIAGVVTNLMAGWIALRLGLVFTLVCGLLLQIVALLALSQLDTSWAVGLSVLYVMLVQGLSGVAKDLTKMSAKSAVKSLAPDNHAGLFGWVAILTGSKNAIKGGGFLLGAALLSGFGFVTSLYLMTGVLVGVFIAVLVFIPKELGIKRKDAKLTEVFSKNRDINWLSFSRLFLFGARDVWFVLGIPIYFYAVLADDTAQSKQAAFFLIGTFMAVWTILYGVVQGAAPRLLKARQLTGAQMQEKARRWALYLIPVPLILAGLFWSLPNPSWGMTLSLVIGLLIFGGIFAVNSSLHSYLILNLSDASRVSLDVGFYYMSNAMGRLIGTVLSGLSYQAGGLVFCLVNCAIMLCLAAVGMWKVNKGQP